MPIINMLIGTCPRYHSVLSKDKTNGGFAPAFFAKARTTLAMSLASKSNPKKNRRIRWYREAICAVLGKKLAIRYRQAVCAVSKATRNRARKSRRASFHCAGARASLIQSSSDIVRVVIVGFGEFIYHGLAMFAILCLFLSASYTFCTVL